MEFTMRTYLQGLQSTELSPESIEFCIRDSVNARVDCSAVPADQPIPTFLRDTNWIELHFDSYAMTDEDRQQLYRALSHYGVGIPGIAYRLRYCEPIQIMVEPRDGSEPELPTDWLSYVLALGPKGQAYRYVGKRVTMPADWNPAGYIETENGWTLEHIDD
jgi:hypothetical protein